MSELPEWPGRRMRDIEQKSNRALRILSRCTSIGETKEASKQCFTVAPACVEFARMYRATVPVEVESSSWIKRNGVTVRNSVVRLECTFVGIDVDTCSTRPGEFIERLGVVWQIILTSASEFDVNRKRPRTRSGPSLLPRSKEFDSILKFGASWGSRALSSIVQVDVDVFALSDDWIFCWMGK
ncbi:hypothetical protein SISNIDRAFT_526047 [Sistotremastrum niveocremeum HHB9708]|uniref:Uncharacterized protein n=1 Tax=Sistotremastrum niveocremeum HHB9708 TaxID=1314777 RepID=A0A164QKK1_9AGAM|nr:hypothetical protein SISNIDRAFT_526047 [Sistotremastrum niveocremeum HHB9708]